MRTSYSHVQSLFLWVLAIAILSLSACKDTQVKPSPMQQLPVIELEIVKPRINANNLVMVMRQQYVQHLGAPGVFVLSADNTARFRMARSGKTEGGWIEITSGLTGEENVLHGPLDKVVDGSPVRLIQN